MRFAVATILVGACLLLGGRAAAMAEETTDRDLVIATPWEVRQKATELLQDLRDGRLERPVLLDRTRDLLIEHGDELISYRDGWVPLSEAIRHQLVEVGLAEAYSTFFQELAQRERERIGSRRGAGELSELARLVAVYPGTRAGQTALRDMVDHAWDRGLLGLYLMHARQAGETEDTARASRVAAARQLLMPGEPDELPTSLAAFGPMWKVGDIPAPPPIRAESRRTVRIGGRQRFEQVEGQPGGDARFTFSRRDGHRLAASNGRHLIVVDPLVGNHDPRPVPVGNHLSPFGARRPVHAGGLFVVSALSAPGQPGLVAVDEDGHERWRATAPPQADNDAFSGPAIVGNTVAFAFTRFNDSYSELHLAAYDLSDGSPLWTRLVAKGHNLQHNPWFQRGATWPPEISTHQGTWLICSNAGLLGQVGPNGQVMGIWSYPTEQADHDLAEQVAQRRAHRTGALLSDGHHVVCTPRDAGHVVVLDPEAGSLRIFHGNGADDQLTDLHDGQALLVGRRITLLEVASLTPRWSLPGNAEARSVDGSLDGERALAVIDDLAVLKDLQDGRTLSSIDLPQDQQVTFADGVLVAAGPDPRNGANLRVVGHGDQQGIDRLLAKIAAQPDDPRPLLALASLQEARGQLPEAYATILQALERGAQPTQATRAARLARIRLDRSVATARFAEALAQLQGLERFTGSIRTERLWWQGLHAELTGATDAARLAYAEALASPPALASFTNGLEADLHALAEAGLFRLAAARRPPWMQDPVARSAPRLVANSLPGAGFLEPPLALDDSLVGYRHGVLGAWPRGGGEALWTRDGGPDDHALLGVTPLDGAVALGQGVTVDVLPGGGAALAGLRRGDRVLSMDGRELNTWTDLVETVRGRPIGSPFTLVVGRDVQRLQLDGHLGSRLMRPIAADGRYVVAHSLGVELIQGGSLQIGLDTKDPMIEVIDRRDGSVRWRRHLRPATKGGVLATEPRLIGDRWLLFADGPELQAYDLQAPDSAKPAWTLPGAGDGTVRIEALNPTMILLTRANSNHVQLVAVGSGRTLFDIPGDPDGPVVFDEGRCWVRNAWGHLTCWDLGKARSPWSSSEPFLQPETVHRGRIYVRDRRRQLLALDVVNGAVEQRFGEWTAVHELAFSDARLYVHGNDLRGRAVIAAVSLRSGTVAWSTPLPGGLELAGALHAWSGGVAGTLASLDEGSGVLAIDGSGRIVIATALAADETLAVDGEQGPVAQGPAGIRPLPRLDAAAAAEPLPCPRLQRRDRDLATVLRDESTALDFLAVPDGGAWAVARLDQDLLLVARFDDQEGGLRIHLGDSGQILDTDDQHLDLLPGQLPVIQAGTGSWTLGESVHAQAGDGSWLLGCIVHPPAILPAGVEPLLQARSRLRPTSPPAVAWWYRGAWSPLGGDAAAPGLPESGDALLPETGAAQPPGAGTADAPPTTTP